MTLELLTLVALWCGNPVIGEITPLGGFGTNLRIHRTHAQVDECRAKMIACLEAKTPVVECAKERKLNE